MVKVGFFQGLSLACLVGLLRFLKWDFSMGLLVCLLFLASIFCGEGVFCSGPVPGMLGGPAAFLEVGFLQRASSLLVVSSFHILW